MQPTTKEAFERLKPVCIPLTKDPSQANLMRLKEILDTVSVEDLQLLQEYVLFPLRLSLKASTLTDKQTIAILECMNNILLKTDVVNKELFVDLFNFLCVMLSSPGKDINIASEEVKTAIITCLGTLVGQSTLSVLEEVYRPDFLPSLGHAVSALLGLITQESCRQLQIAAMESLMALGQAHRKGDQHLMSRVADIFASFLPGISIALGKVIKGDIRQGQAVTVQGLHTWASLVSLVIGDSSLHDAQEKQQKPAVKDEKLRQLVIQRSPDWVKVTVEKLDILIGRIATLTSYANWKVRMALVEWADKLLKKCTKSLKASLPKILEVVVALANDDYPNVQKRSVKVLEDFKEYQSKEGVKTLVELLEENLHNLATTLPRIIRTVDENEKLKTLQLLNGYLKILGPRVSLMFNSSSHLKRLGWSLVQIVELSCHDINIMEERTSIISAADSLQDKAVATPSLKRRKSFKHFTDRLIHMEVCKTCQYLGLYGDLTVTVDYFSELILSSSLYRKEAILILNEVILGTLIEKEGEEGKRCVDKELVCDIISSLIKDYVSDSLLNLPTNVISSGRRPSPVQTYDISQRFDLSTTGKNPSPTLLTINSNIQQVCLLLEGLAAFATALEEDFKPFLITVLYPLLENLGSDILVVSQTAFSTLQTVCSCCKYGSISELICSNVDYLVNSISLKMRHYSGQSKVPLVLCVMFDNSNKELLPYVEDTVQEIFSCLDEHHTENITQLVKVLSRLVSAINRWFGNEESKTDTPASLPSKQESPESFRQYFLDHHKQKVIAKSYEEEDIEDEPEPTEPMDEVTNDPDVKKVIPLHVKVVTSVLERCGHLASSRDRHLRLLILDIISNGCRALHTETDELLPAAHKLWAPVVERLQDDEPVVIIKTFETVCIMGDVCGDFLNRRVAKEILPKVADYLVKQAPISERSGSNQKFRFEYKAQCSILKRIGQLCKKLQIEEENCEVLITGCLPYLSDRQPLTLQQACLDTFHCFIEVDPDIVWLRLMDTFCPDPLTYRNTDLPHIKFPDCRERAHYAQNVKKLLERLESDCYER